MKKRWLAGVAILGFMLVSSVAFTYNMQWPSRMVGRWRDMEDEQHWIDLKPDHSFKVHDHTDPEYTGWWKINHGLLTLDTQGRFQYECDVKPSGVMILGGRPDRYCAGYEKIPLAP